jgi:hypothetical protein
MAASNSPTPSIGSPPLVLLGLRFRLDLGELQRPVHEHQRLLVVLRLRQMQDLADAELVIERRDGGVDVLARA